MDKMKKMTQEELNELEKEIVQQSSQMPDKVIEEPIETESNDEPELVLSGNFKDTDSFHKGSGAAGIYTLPDESQLLCLEDFRVTNGPDLRVILTKHPNPTSRNDVQEGYIELGKLRGNVGNQNYTITQDIDISEYNNVVIYYKPFHVIFSTASLQ